MTPKEVDPHEYPGLEVVMRQTGNRIAESLPPDVGFAFLCYHFGEGGGLSYMSNGAREDMVKVLEEFLEKQPSSRLFKAS